MTSAQSSTTVYLASPNWSVGGVGVGEGVGVGVGVGAVSVTATQGENSEVLPAGSVAVAVMKRSARVTELMLVETLASPAPSVVTVFDSTNCWPSPFFD